ncbi:hypothetical protein ACFCYI_00425 [Streptomyces sp. NPDC056257]|uniref:hypothetical protein n=1 Tax=Streptomyces sp. NPDC056257 TaxID=3345765 RepID=UPI0035E2E8CF
MPSRSAHRSQPTVACLVAGLLLACGFLMWGAGHAGAMGTHPRQAGAATAPSPGTTEMAEPAAMAAPAAMADMPGGGTATEDMGGDCPAMAMDCPLASAHLQGAVALASPPASALPPALADQVPASRAPAVECARPRAPDPVSLLCVSRT